MNVALGQAQQRQPGMRLPTLTVRLPVVLLGGGRLPAQPVQLSLQVQRFTDGGVTEEPVEGPRGLVGRFGPVTVQHHHLGAVDEALTVVEHQFGLAPTPPAECRCPLLHALDVEEFVTAVDRSAVDVADGDR
ncbi:hypothetical protein [Nocardia sp. 348MFTsu5.1]|uniref:hypothetical protein n=1 Tax=Nocardia sp. 348MFTsu5.1 TaxID=1172185 RepID=UPI0003633ACE|nr:hypothetical protein [Nocardia sp. 348MFTsu5.1]